MNGMRNHHFHVLTCILEPFAQHVYVAKTTTTIKVMSTKHLNVTFLKLAVRVKDWIRTWLKELACSDFAKTTNKQKSSLVFKKKKMLVMLCLLHLSVS